MGKSVTLTDLGIFSQIVGKSTALKRCDVHLSGHAKITVTKRTHQPKSSEHLLNCNFANLLVCRINGYHLTKMLQIKTSISKKKKKKKKKKKITFKFK